MRVLSCLLVGLVLVEFSLAQCPSSAEQLANAVELTFYRAQMDQWTSDGNSEKVAVQVSNKATTYCGANPTGCGLFNCCAPAFKETDVGTETGYPQDSLKDMKLKLYLLLPTGNSPSSTPVCVLGKTVVQSIVDLARDDIHTETGHWITYIDDEFYGIPPATELNKIIIPIAFVILIAIAGLTIGLNLWKKKKDSDARRMKIIEDRKKHSKAKVQPTYHVDTTETKVPPGIDGQNKDQLYKDSLRQQLRQSKEDSPRKTESEPYQRQSYAFQKNLELEAPQGATGHDGRGYIGSHSTNSGMREPEKIPLTHLTPIQPDTLSADTAETPEKKKKKKKKRSKSKESMSVQDNGVTDIPRTTTTTVWDYSLASRKVQGRDNATYDY